MHSDLPPFEMNAIPVRRAGICCHEMDGEAVLYDPAHHALHYLNATAFFIWNSCEGQATIGEFLDQAGESFSYAGEPEQLREDLMAAVSHLVENGLIDWGQLQAA